MLNHWTYARELILPPNDAGGIATNLGVANRPPGLRLRARVRGSSPLGQAHRLTLWEDRGITNTMDPERGVHRHRGYGNALPDWLYLKLGMVHDDIHVFHQPGSFTDNGGGTRLAEALGSGVTPASTGWWLLTPDPIGTLPPSARYFFVELTNLEDHPTSLTLELDYNFVTP
jgi:hypothetical protein